MILCSMLVVVLFSRFLADAYFWFCYLSFVCLNICGLALSGRHIWLQSQPVLDSSPIQCLPSLEILWNWMPVDKFFTTIVHGDALCQAITWSFLGLSLAMWLGMIYLLVFVCWLYFGYKRLLKVS
jgi:protein dithiol:quinone oxidoreductase